VCIAIFSIFVVEHQQFGFGFWIRIFPCFRFEFLVLLFQAVSSFGFYSTKKNIKVKMPHNTQQME
jgi:hypothetical protein